MSGDTSAGGLRRLDWALEGDVAILIVALGGNDGLRGLPPTQLKKNLATIIERAQARGMPVILAGMEAPPNFGADYTRAFRQVYPRPRDATYHVRFIPFLLEGVAGDPSLNQARRHSSERARRADRGGPRVGGPRAGARRPDRPKPSACKTARPGPRPA